MHFSLAQDNVKMLPVAVNVVLAVHRSWGRNFYPCIFDCATYSCLAVSVDPTAIRNEISLKRNKRPLSDEFFKIPVTRLGDLRLKLRKWA